MMTSLTRILLPMLLLSGISLQANALQIQVQNNTDVDFDTVKVAPPMSENLGPLLHHHSKTVTIPDPDAYVIYIASRRYRVQVIKTADDPSPYCPRISSDFRCHLSGDQVEIVGK